MRVGGVREFVSVPWDIYLDNWSENKGAFRFPGATWDRFPCAVEPSPSDIRFRVVCHCSGVGEREEASEQVARG